MNTKEIVLITIRFPDIVGYKSAEYRAECEIEIQNDYAWQIAHEYETNNAAIPENVQNALDEYCGQNWVLAALEDGSDVISELAMFFFVIDNSPCGLPNEPEELAEYMEIDYVPYPDCSLQNASNLHNDYFTESVAKWIADNVSSELIEQCNSNRALLAELWNALIEAIEESDD